MEQNKFDQMLKLVAHAYDMTPDVFYHKMAVLVLEGQQSNDPQAQSLWSSIPHAGSSVTVEDFVEFLAQTLPRPFEP